MRELRDGVNYASKYGIHLVYMHTMLTLNSILKYFVDENDS